MICECAVEISGAAPVKRVGDDAQLRAGERLEIHELVKALDVRTARIDFLERRVVRLCGRSLAEFCGARAAPDADGAQFDMAEDALSRAGAPAPQPHRREGSLPRPPAPGLRPQPGAGAGLLKPAPADAFGRGGGTAADARLVGGAAPMGSRATTPRSTESAWL